MKELRRITEAWAALRAHSEPALLATVVETAGSTYRRPGARLLMSQDRWLAGGISGGCLEGEVLKKAWWRTREWPGGVDVRLHQHRRRGVLEFRARV